MSKALMFLETMADSVSVYNRFRKKYLYFPLNSPNAGKLMMACGRARKNTAWNLENPISGIEPFFQSKSLEKLTMLYRLKPKYPAIQVRLFQIRIA